MCISPGGRFGACMQLLQTEYTEYQDLQPRDEPTKHTPEVRTQV
jgi:hypothetical protein